MWWITARNTGRITAGLSTARRAAMALALSGCATLERGLDDEVAVLSEPPGAAVTTSIGVTCAATPCTLSVGRRATFTVTLSKPGYASRTVPVETRLSGTGVALATENVATGGLGVAVDAATGGALEHTPNPVSVTLTAPAAQAAKPGSMPAKAGGAA